MKKFIEGYKRFTPFTDEEAWSLFKMAAWGEAVGWTLLISGIICQEVIHNNIPVLITGQFHGLLFLIYIAASVILAPSLRWPLRRTLIAGLCAVPPYGSLLFEMRASQDRRRAQLNQLGRWAVYWQLLTKLS